MIKFQLGERLICLSDEELDELYINEGKEGNIYRFEDKAIKVYKEHCSKDRLSEDDCKRMIVIPSDKFLLPRGIVYDGDDQFVGYYTIYVPLNAIKESYRLKRDEFIGHINVVDEELKVLAHHNLCVEDLWADNCYYHNGFYFLDPGSFYFKDQKSYQSVLSHNRSRFDEFLLDDYLVGMGISKKQRAIIANHFMGADYLPDMFVDDFKANETVKQYFKRITL